MEAVGLDTQMLANFFLASFDPFFTWSCSPNPAFWGVPSVTANAGVAMANTDAAAAAIIARLFTISASELAAHLTGPICKPPKNHTTHHTLNQSQNTLNQQDPQHQNATIPEQKDTHNGKIIPMW
jgi:hypothetical protein